MKKWKNWTHRKELKGQKVKGFRLSGWQWVQRTDSASQTSSIQSVSQSVRICSGFQEQKLLHQLQCNTSVDVLMQHILARKRNKLKTHLDIDMKLQKKNTKQNRTEQKQKQIFQPPEEVKAGLHPAGRRC